MHIDVSRQPTSTGTYRYRVSARGRSNEGYRATQAQAHTAAREDGELLVLCGQISGRDEREKDTDREVREPRRRMRRMREGLRV
jgi:hypothetical protein